MPLADRGEDVALLLRRRALARDRHAGQQVGFLAVGEPADLGNESLHPSAYLGVVEGAAAADNELTAVRVGDRELARHVRVQFERAVRVVPPPRLRVVDGCGEDGDADDVACPLGRQQGSGPGRHGAGSFRDWSR